MDDERFRERVQRWDTLPGDLADGNYTSYPHPLDAKLDALCALYLDATLPQRDQLAAVVLPDIIDSRVVLIAANNLLAYIRRYSRRIRDEGGTQPLRFAMVAAAVAAGRVDERDLAVALVFLRAGADRADISANAVLHLLDKTLPEPPSESRTPRGKLMARRVVIGVWRSDERTISRILAYHVGTG